MGILKEGLQTGEFLLSEANGNRSRETVTFMNDCPNMESGTAVGKITASGLWGKYDHSATNGLEVCRGVAYSAIKTQPSAQKGVVIARDAEISFERTVGIDSLAQDALADVGIVVRGPTIPFVAPAPEGPA